MNVAINVGDAIKVGLGDFLGAELPGVDFLGKVGRGHAGELGGTGRTHKVFISHNGVIPPKFAERRSAVRRLPVPGRVLVRV